MKGKRIGYIRVSSLDQNTERQLDGVVLDRVFIDHVSGKNADRPELIKCLDYIRDGDTLVVHSIDRAARSLIDLLNLVTDLTDRDIGVEFVKEGLKFAGKADPMSELILSIMGAVAQFERAVINERQREGIAIAKRKGIYKGRKPALADLQQSELAQRLDSGESRADLARHFGIGRTTLYKYIKLMEHKR